jgi:hypothetical protein
MTTSPADIAAQLDDASRRVMLSGSLNGENLSIGFHMCSAGLIGPHVHAKTNWAVTFTQLGEQVLEVLRAEASVNQ